MLMSATSEMWKTLLEDTARDGPKGREEHTELRLYLAAEENEVAKCCWPQTNNRLGRAGGRKVIRRCPVSSLLLTLLLSLPTQSSLLRTPWPFP